MDEGTAVRSRRLSSQLSGETVVIQRNRFSGSGARHRRLSTLIQALRAYGLKVRMFSSRAALDRYVTEHRSSIRCIVAAGGDGTAADVCGRHPDIPAALLPTGTENLLARFLGIRCDGAAIAGMIRDGQVRVMDSAVAGDRPFILMASAGVDADVVHRLAAARSGNIRRLTYLRPIATALLTYRSEPIEVRSPDLKDEVSGSHVIVTNVPKYGFGFQFCPNADPGDGLLDVRVFRCVGRVRTLLHALRTRLLPQWPSADVIRFRTRRVQLASGSSRVPLQCDGDPAGCLPTEIRIRPGTLRLVVPVTDRPDSE